MPNSEKSAAFAQLTEQLHQARTARHASEQAAAQTATPQQQEGKLSDLFSEVFAKPTVTHYHPRQEAATPERIWDQALRLVASDDDAPQVPTATAEPAPAGAEPAPGAVAPPAEETRARQAGSADELFERMQQQLTATAEITDLPADVQLRRAFRELPGSQREAIAKLIEAQDFGLPGYFDSRNFGPDYVAVLVSSALARRFSDAQRLQPGLSPAQLLEQISAAAG
jgi:hypothetical protein